MLKIEGEQKKLQLWVGASLKHFGTNLYDEPLFRVVWAPSRYYIVGGEHVERSGKMPNDAEFVANDCHDYSIERRWVGYKWYPLYPKKQCYILEKWLSPVEFAGTPENWEIQQKDFATGLLVLGPYPHRGEYQSIWEFESGYPTVNAVETVIRMALYSRRFTLAERKRALIEADEKERLDLIQKRKEVILESQPAFGFNATNVNTAKKKPEDVKLRYSTKDLRRMGMWDPLESTCRHASLSIL